MKPEDALRLIATVPLRFLRRITPRYYAVEAVRA